MSQHLVAEGHDVAFGSLNVIDPQPTSRGIQFTERVPNLDGSNNDVGPYCELVWQVLESEDDYLAVLAQFGLDDADESEVTVYIRDKRLQWAKYNATAVLPAIGSDGGWDDLSMRNVIILLRDLELAA